VVQNPALKVRLLPVRDQPNSPDHNLYRNSAYSSRLLRVAVLLAFAGIIGTLPVSTSGQSAESLYNDAGIAYDGGDVKRAIELYRQLVRMAPSSVQARTNLGVALAHEGRYSDAIAQYREALQQDLENATVCPDLALASYKQADFAKSRNSSSFG
jgi:tetratricopeptide (TPR) repeat protein